MRGWESQRSAAPLYPRRSVTGSQGEKDEGGPTEEDFGEAMHIVRPWHRTLPARAGRKPRPVVPLTALYSIPGGKARARALSSQGFLV